MKSLVILIALLALPSNAYFIEINAPSKIIVGENFNIYINANISNFDAANYTIKFPSWVEILDIQPGKIGNVTIPINGSVIKNETCSILQNIPGIGNVSGNGYIALIKAKAKAGGIANLSIDGIASDCHGYPINLTWIGATIKSYETYIKINSPVEAYENDTISANIILYNVENINAANFEIDYANLQPIKLSSPYNFSFSSGNGSIKVFILFGNESGNLSMLNISFKCLGSDIANIGIKNITLSNIHAEKIDVYAENTSLTIFKNPFPPWDINKDGKINILDLIMVARHWMETGSPGWIREDVNDDGVVNILDLIMVARHWTG